MVSIADRMKLVVPLTIPITRVIRSPASDSRSGRSSGIAPATAASKYRSAPDGPAAANRSAACSASSALFAVTTDLPARSALVSSARAGLDAADHLDHDVHIGRDEPAPRRW